MFFLLRIFLVIGVIYYLSPLREDGDPLPMLTWLADWAKPAPAQAPATAASAASAAPEPSGTSTKLESLWKALPDSAKQAVVEEILSRAGDPGQAAKPSPAAADTLHPDDRRPAWRGESQRPRT